MNAYSNHRLTKSNYTITYTIIMYYVIIYILVVSYKDVSNIHQY